MCQNSPHSASTAAQGVAGICPGCAWVATEGSGPAPTGCKPCCELADAGLALVEDIANDRAISSII
jgi:hypothetical protein